MALTSKQILRAAVVPKRENRVYCIGSFAKNVNFLAQQRRALNLIWALSEEGWLEGNPRVAVIGGGLAGVTAAAALIGFGAKVDLFEKGGRVLHRQRTTSHRRVHPTINAWPKEPLSLTTELPFYDWATGFCSEIAEEIAVHFETAMDQLGYHIHTEVTAKDTAPIGAKLVRIVTTPSVKNVEGYDLVLVTVGYGDEIVAESVQPDTKKYSYWENDNLEMDRDKGSLFQDYVVSGCGDGGLIDALRIVHVDFGEGRLAFELATRLSGTPIAKSILAAEDIALTGKGQTTTKDLAEQYKLSARQIAEEPQYSDINAKLKKSMRKFNRIVYLGDRSLTEPYSIKSAPIHKLLLAHAMQTEGNIKFETSEVSKGPGNTVKLGQFKFESTETKVVIRHGAKPEFRNLLGEKDRQVVQRKQDRLKDRCAEQAWPANFTYPTPPGWSADLNSREYTRIRREMAKRAFEIIIPGASVTDRPGKFRVDLDSPPPPDAPKNMFRVPVEYIVDTESEAL